MNDKNREPDSDEQLKKRTKEAEEMAAIWEQSETDAHMYLKGCITTAMALAGNKKAG